MIKDIDVFLTNNFNVSQFKILLCLYKENIKYIEDIANQLNFKTSKVITEIKKIDHENIDVYLEDSSIRIEIDESVFILEKMPKTRNKIITKIDEKEQKAKEIFEFWKNTFPNEDGSLKRTRFTTFKRHINGALDQYSEELVRDAIIGCSKSLFHMGYDNEGNKTGTTYNSLELILRPSKIEQFIQKSKLENLETQLNKLKGNNSVATSNDEWLNSRNRVFGGNQS